jgi:glycosyltransferase involved in cell wall biosynthesis
VDTHFFQPGSVDASVPGRVAFVGATYVAANLDAVEFLVATIWPQIRAARPGVSLRLIGRTAVSERARYDAIPGVETLGHVGDIRPHVAAARCCVVPIRIGGGTRLKILDSWAMGKAVVSTSVGCEGLDAVDGQNILIRDDADGFAAAVVQVLSDEALRTRLERNARRTAEETYSWEVIGHRLRASYRALLDSA